MGAKMKPIIFNSESVKAILDGRKTQTRRVIKLDSPDNFRYDGINEVNSHIFYDFITPDVVDGLPYPAVDRYHIFPCPYGIPSDKLWVRETFFYEWPTEDPPEDMRDCRIVYRATEPGYIAEFREFDPETYRWSPSIHMSKWASRITLEIKGVRVERVQDIAEEDAKAEGVSPGRVLGYGRVGMKSYLEGFIEYWDSINAKRGFGWEMNPFVFVIDFSVVGM